MMIGCFHLLDPACYYAFFLRTSLASSQSTRFVKISQNFEMIWLFHTWRVGGTVRASNWLSKGRRFEPQHRRFFTPNQWPPFPRLLLLALYTIGASFLRMSLASSQSTRFVKIGQNFETIWFFHTRIVNYFNMYGLVLINCRKCLIYT